MELPLYYVDLNGVAVVKDLCVSRLPMQHQVARLCRDGTRKLDRRLLQSGIAIRKSGGNAAPILRTRIALVSPVQFAPLFSGSLLCIQFFRHGRPVACLRLTGALHDD